MRTTEKVEALRKLIEEQTRERMLRDYPNTPSNLTQCAKIKIGRKYVNIDVGPEGNMSGKYMIDEDGNIFGIKAYGVIHRGHQYGTLDTIDMYYWGGYAAVRKA